MLKTLARLALLRVLPRRIVPIVTVVETILFLRSIRNRSRMRVNAPTESRTAPPAPPVPPAADRLAADPLPADRLAAAGLESLDPQSPTTDPV